MVVSEMMHMNTKTEMQVQVLIRALVTLSLTGNHHEQPMACMTTCRFC